MRYLMTIAAVLLCSAVFLAGCSKKTPSGENRQASQDRQVPQNTQASENPPSSPSSSTPPSPSASVSTSPSTSLPAEVVVLNEANFDTQIGQGVVLVDFWATWCGPCRIQGPIVEQVAKQIGDVAKVAKLDVDAVPTIARRFNITSIPTLIIFKDGKPVKQFVGITQAETLVSTIQAALKSQA